MIISKTCEEIFRKEPFDTNSTINFANFLRGIGTFIYNVLFFLMTKKLSLC